MELYEYERMIEEEADRQALESQALENVYEDFKRRWLDEHEDEIREAFELITFEERYALIEEEISRMLEDAAFERENDGVPW